MNMNPMAAGAAPPATPRAYAPSAAATSMSPPAMKKRLLPFDWLSLITVTSARILAPRNREMWVDCWACGLMPSQVVRLKPDTTSARLRSHDYE